MVYAPVLHRPQDLAIANRVHLHLLSDSTGETLEMLAKAALAQFEDADVIRHFWPMVRSRQHLERILPELKDNPGLVLFTLVNPDTRNRLEEACTQLGLPAVPILDRVTEALEKAGGIDKSVKFDFNGDGSVWAQGTSAEVSDKDADCVINVDKADFISLAKGEMDPMMAFMSGKLKIEGDMGIAMKLQGVLKR